jgi:hypothetical protein
MRTSDKTMDLLDKQALAAVGEELAPLVSAFEQLPYGSLQELSSRLWAQSKAADAEHHMHRVAQSQKKPGKVVDGGAPGKAASLRSAHLAQLARFIEDVDLRLTMVNHRQDESVSQSDP